MNRASGHHDKQAAQQQIEEVFAASGCRFTVLHAPAGGLVAAVRQAVGSECALPLRYEVFADALSVLVPRIREPRQ